MSKIIDWKKARCKCPECGRSGKDETFGISLNSDGSRIGHCFRCSYVERLNPDDSHRMIRNGTARPPVNQQKFTSLSPFGRAMWNESLELSGTLGEKYLRSRNCVIPPSDGDLRYHPAVLHRPSNYTGPALIALLTDLVSGEPISLHRTWICENGTKPDIFPVRMLLGNHRKDGGVIRLWPDWEVTNGLGIGEGIETCLSLGHAVRPVWSLVDAGNMAKLPVLSGIECLTIATDADEPGIEAANKCATRWHKAGVEVQLALPKSGDLNDIAKGVTA